MAAPSSGSPRRYALWKASVYAGLRTTLDLRDGWCGTGMPEQGPIDDVVPDSQATSQGTSTVMTTAPPYMRHGLVHEVLEALPGNNSDIDVDGDFVGEPRIDSSQSTLRQLFWNTRGIAPSAAVLQTLVFLGKVAIGVGRTIQYEGLNAAMKEANVRPGLTVCLSAGGGKSFCKSSPVCAQQCRLQQIYQ